MEKNIANFTYSNENILGRGSYSSVYKGKNKASGEEVAIKMINKQLLKAKENADNIKGEIQVMRQLSHPNIVHMFEVY